MNGHTALIRSFGITGVLLLLALVLLAIVSAIVAFDRWPDGGGASSVERVAVDRPDVRRVQTVLVRARRSAPVVRGVFVARSASGASATALGAGDVLLVGDREPTDQSDGGGFGPPPPSVPFAAPGEGGGGLRAVGGGGGGGASPVPGEPESPSVIRQATCGAREALGEAGAPLDNACSNPERRGSVAQLVSGTVATVTETVSSVTDEVGLDAGVQVELTLSR